jgi:hypothetical protein
MAPLEKIDVFARKPDLASSAYLAAQSCCNALYNRPRRISSCDLAFPRLRIMRSINKLEL